MRLLNNFRAAHKMRVGIAAARKQRLDKAADCLQKAVELAPEKPLPRLHLARALAAGGNWEEAFPALNKALEFAGDSPAVIILAGVVRFDAGDFLSAKQLFDRALKMNPRNDLAKAYRTLTQWRLTGDHDYAAQLRRQGVPDSPDFACRLILTIEEDELHRRMKKTEQHYASISPLAEILTGEEQNDIPIFRMIQ